MKVLFLRPVQTLEKALKPPPWKVAKDITQSYNEMANRQQHHVLKNGISPHENLTKKADNRQFIAAYALWNQSNFQGTKALDLFLEQEYSLMGMEHYYYMPLSNYERNSSKLLGAKIPVGYVESDEAMQETLHWMLMQLVGFQKFGKIEVPEGYADVIEAALQRYFPILNIYFYPIVLTPTNIIMLRYPSVNVNEA